MNEKNMNNYEKKDDSVDKSNRRIVRFVIIVLIIIIIILLLLHACYNDTGDGTKTGGEDDKTDVIDDGDSKDKTDDGTDDGTSDDSTSDGTSSGGGTTSSTSTSSSSKTSSSGSGSSSSSSSSSTSTDTTDDEDKTISISILDDEGTSVSAKLDIFSGFTSSKNVSGTVAPLDTDTYKFSISNTGNVDVTYSFYFGESNPYEIDMRYRLTDASGNYIAGNSTTWVSADDLKDSNISLKSGRKDTYYLEWKWFESGNDTNAAGTSDYILTLNVDAEG